MDPGIETDDPLRLVSPLFHHYGCDWTVVGKSSGLRLVRWYQKRG
jgi:hypothetical protein